MIKLAIIGTNWITEKFVEAALKTGKYQLAAVYSRDFAKGQSFAQKFNTNKVICDLTQLANDKDIDVVYIASPNSLHFSQSKLMLEQGKDVICEKPLTSNIKQTKILIETAKKNQRIIFEALKIYYQPNYQIVKEYLPKLGKIRKALLSYCQYSSRYQRYLDGENPNTFNPEFSNGSIMDIGVYPLNFAVGLWGAPKTVQAEACLLDSGVDAHGSVLMNYGDFDAIILHSKVSDSFVASEIQGEQGSLLIDHISIVERVVYKPRQGEAQEISIKHDDNDMIYEAEQFAALFKQRKVDHDGINHSLISSQLITEIRQQTGVVFPADKV